MVLSVLMDTAGECDGALAEAACGRRAVFHTGFDGAHFRYRQPSCDVFLHGLGRGLYCRSSMEDLEGRVMERWPPGGFGSGGSNGA